MIFNSKNRGKRCFSIEAKVSISFILMRGMCLWCLIIKEKRLLCESAFVQIEERTLILKMEEREVFHMKPKHQFIYPSVENEFVVPNH